MLQFFRARLLETVDLAALRVDTAQNVADRAVLAGGVHGLKDQEHRVAVGGVVQPLQVAELLDVRGEKLLYCFSDL